MGKTSSQSKQKYNEKAYDRIAVCIKKGRKEAVKEHAEKLGLSLNGYIIKLIEEDMNNA